MADTDTFPYNKLEDSKKQNFEDFKTELAIDVHSWEFPPVWAMHSGDFIKANYLKTEFEKFRSLMIDRIEKL